MLSSAFWNVAAGICTLSFTRALVRLSKGLAHSWWSSLLRKYWTGLCTGALPQHANTSYWMWIRRALFFCITLCSPSFRRPGKAIRKSWRLKITHLCHDLREEKQNNRHVPEMPCFAVLWHLMYSSVGKWVAWSCDISKCQFLLTKQPVPKRHRNSLVHISHSL